MSPPTQFGKNSIAVVSRQQGSPYSLLSPPVAQRPGRTPSHYRSRRHRKAEPVSDFCVELPFLLGIWSYASMLPGSADLHQRHRKPITSGRLRGELKGNPESRQPIPLILRSPCPVLPLQTSILFVLGCGSGWTRLFRFSSLSPYTKNPPTNLVAGRFGTAHRETNRQPVMSRPTNQSTKKISRYLTRYARVCASLAVRVRYPLTN